MLAVAVRSKKPRDMLGHPGMYASDKNLRKIIPVISGKGGVGKSLVAANTGAALAMAGLDVVLVDLDLGGSNLHTYLGVRNRSRGLGNAIAAGDRDIAALAVDTEVAGLRLVPGDTMTSGVANPSAADRKRIVAAVEGMDADFVIADLGAGASDTVLDLAVMSNSPILVVAPTVPSVLNAYALLKNIVAREFLRLSSRQKTVHSWLKEQFAEREPGSLPPIAEITAGIERVDQETADVCRAFLREYRPNLVLSMAHTAESASLAERLRDLCRRNLDMQLGCLGAVSFDPLVQRTERFERPMVAEEDGTLAAAQIHRIAEKLRQSPRFPRLALALDLYKDSFELMRMEMEADQAAGGEGAPGHEADGATIEEFVAIIAQQKRTINELRSTIKMLTMREGGGR